jgi:LuxR family transcriptional regulator
LGSSINFLVEQCLNGLAALNGCKDEQEVLTMLDALYRRLGFYGYSYAPQIPNITLATESRYSSFWHPRYREAWLGECFHLESPSQKAIANRQDWVWNASSDDGPEQIRRLFGFLKQTTAKSGIAFAIDRPLSGIGAFTLGADQFVDLESGVIDTVKFLANAAAMRIRRLDSKDTTPDAATQHLTPRQVEILRWVAIGKSNGEIAIIMGLSERNVVYHLSQIFKRLDVCNRTQAVAEFLSSTHSNTL